MRAICLIAGLILAASAPAQKPNALPDGNAAPAVARGRALYAQKCMQCHGVNMVNPGTSSYDLRKFPADQYARFANSVANGKNAMPAWKGTLTPEDIEALWAYVCARGKS